MMKYLFSLLALFGLLFVLPQVKVRAEEDVEPMTEEVVEEEEQEEQPIVIENKNAQEIVTEVAEKYLGEYLDKQLIADIVALLFGMTGVVGVFVTNLIYRKSGKSGVNAFMDALEKNDGKHLKEFIAQLEQDKEKLANQVNQLKVGYETIMKVLVLMQDSTPKGKIALIEYLGSKTNDDSIQEVVKEVGEEIKKQEEVKAEVNEKVNGDYEEIF